MKPIVLHGEGQFLLDGNGYAGEINVQSPGTAHTKGSWTTVIATLDNPTSEFVFMTNPIGSGGTERRSLIDIALGPSGAPTMLVENLLIGYLHDAEIGWPEFHLPIQLPAGGEIIMRSQSTLGSISHVMHVAAYGSNMRDLLTYKPPVVTYGADTANTKGVTIPLGGAVNTYGAWTEIVAATSEDHWGLGLGIGVDWGPALTTATYALDIAIGGAGSEVPIAEALSFRTTTAEIVYDVWPRPLPLPWAPFIPAGTRLSVRSKATNLFTPPHVCLYGFSQPAGFHYRKNLASSGGLTARLEG